MAEEQEPEPRESPDHIFLADLAVFSFEDPDELISALTRAFERQAQRTHRCRMVGFLFARPESPLAKSDVFPHLEYFHHRSGNYIDFFCAGFRIDPETPPNPHLGDEVLGEVKGWSFSPKKFNMIRRQFEKVCSWQYSGRVDLILTNALYDPDRKIATIDFSSSIVCKLDEMKATGAIPSVEPFFEQIARFAEEFTGDDPTWGFSDQLGVGVAQSALKRVVLSLLPKGLGGDVQKAMQMAVVDISKTTESR